MENHNLISYGQHYLQDKNILNCMINYSNLNITDVVLEIGAGDGRITKELAKRAKKVFSYEIDTRTKPILLGINKTFKNIEFIFENFLNAKFLEFNKIVASLPYQITEPFIHKIARLEFDSATLLVGKTFAKSLLTDKEVNCLSLFTKAYFNYEYLCDVAPECFNPPPKTYSAIIKLTPKEKKQLINDRALFVIRELYEQRDKKISNALREALIRYESLNGKVLTKRQSKNIISELFGNITLDCYLDQSSNDLIKTIYEKINLNASIKKC